MRAERVAEERSGGKVELGGRGRERECVKIEVEVRRCWIAVFRSCCFLSVGRRGERASWSCERARSVCV